MVIMMQSVPLSKHIFTNISKYLFAPTGSITNIGSMSTVNNTKSTTINQVDDLQQEAMLKDMCLLVNENDEIIGKTSKRNCHLVQENGNIALHRAFSVFLFNSNGDLLVQKRASGKLTYPDCYTNSCCSHPLANYVEESNKIDAIGIRIAAQRRLNYELGIPLNQLPIENIHYITRVHYKDLGNGTYGEHELDYILFIQKDVELKPNPWEVSDIRYLTRTEVANLFTAGERLTPWFDLITKHKLKQWWANLSQLDKIKDHENILRLT